MDTLPLDLLRLLDCFSDYGLRSTLSLNYESFNVPMRCNNLKEAIATNNWCYINTHFYTSKPSRFELAHEYKNSKNMYQYPLSMVVDIIDETKKLIFEIDPNYGPPHSLFKSRGLGKESYQSELRKLDQRYENTTPITLPLITHTPIAHKNGKLCYCPVVGSICSHIVTNFVVIRHIDEKNITLIKPVIFINSSIVKYDYHAKIVALHFNKDSKKWYNKRFSGNFEFDQFAIFDNKMWL